MITGASKYLDLPAVPVAVGGVLAAAKVIDASDPHLLLGAEFESDACAEALTWIEFCTEAGVQCPTYVPPSTGLKTFDDAPELIVGEPFAAYAGVDCDMQRVDESKARAEARLAYGERRVVDDELLTVLAATAADAGGGPYSLAEGIGVLENYAASVYGGVPTIVVPLHLVPCGCSNGLLRINPDGSLTTCQGSPVANVVTTIADPATAYVTGQITLIRGPVNSYSVPSQQLCDDTWAPPRALAERIYVPLIECLAASVEVTCS